MEQACKFVPCTQYLTLAEFSRPDLVTDIFQCCGFERSVAGVDASLQCIIQMCSSSELQVYTNFETNLPFDLSPNFQTDRKVSDMKCLMGPISTFSKRQGIFLFGNRACGKIRTIIFPRS